MKKTGLAFGMALISLLMLSGARLPTEAAPVPTPEPTAEVIDRVEWWDTHPEDDPRPAIGEATAAARVADAVCPDGNKEVKSAIIQCVYNRSLAAGFPDTIEEAANQPHQWEGLNSNVQASMETKTLAKELISQWKNGEGYLIPLNCVYMAKEADGLHFRSLWNGETERIVPYERG